MEDNLYLINFQTHTWNVCPQNSNLLNSDLQICIMWATEDYMASYLNKKVAIFKYAFAVNSILD